MPVLPTGTFNPADHNEMRQRSIAPPGDYIAKINKQELKSNSAKTGQYLEIESVIAAGDYKGTSFITRLNLDNPNETAVKIAAEELSTLSKACGHPEPITNTDILTGIAHVVALDIEPASGKYGPKNVATFYKSAVGLTEPPVNPEPNELVLAMMQGSPAQEPATQAPEPPPPAPPVMEPPPQTTAPTPEPTAQQGTPPPAAPPW